MIDDSSSRSEGAAVMDVNIRPYHGGYREVVPNRARTPGGLARGWSSILLPSANI